MFPLAEEVAELLVVETVFRHELENVVFDLLDIDVAFVLTILSG